MVSMSRSMLSTPAFLTASKFGVNSSSKKELLLFLITKFIAFNKPETKFSRKESYFHFYKFSFDCTDSNYANILSNVF